MKILYQRYYQTLSCLMYIFFIFITSPLRRYSEMKTVSESFWHTKVYMCGLPYL